MGGKLLKKQFQNHVLKGMDILQGAVMLNLCLL